MSQFIEMFGNPEKTKQLSDFIEASFPGEWGEEDKDGTGVNVIRTTNFTNEGKLNLEDVVTRKIDSSKVEKKKLKKGDIILERSGGTNENPVGRVVFYDEEGTYLFNNFTQLLRCKEEVCPLFIFYSLFNYYQTNKSVIRSMGNKTTGIQNLKMDNYWKIPIADVTYENQESFVAIYKQADKSEFNGFKSQFIEMFGDQNTNERCWEDSFIKELFSLSMGKTPARNRPDFWQQSSNKWISISDMAKYNRYTGDTDETISDIAVKETGIKKVPKGTIIMSFKLSIGRTAITSEDIYTNEAIMAFQDVDTNKFDISFLYYLIANKNWLYNAKQAVKGQTLNKESIGNSKIIVPPIALQKQFANILNQADKSEYDECYPITKPKVIC